MYECYKTMTIYWQMRELFGPTVLSVETRLENLHWDNTHLQKTIVTLHEKIAKLEWLLKLVYNCMDLVCVQMGAPLASPVVRTSTHQVHIIDLDTHSKPEAPLS